MFSFVLSLIVRSQDYCYDYEPDFYPGCQFYHRREGDPNIGPSIQPFEAANVYVVPPLCFLLLIVTFRRYHTFLQLRKWIS